MEDLSEMSKERRWYFKHKEEAYARHRQYKLQQAQNLRDYKATLSCSMCGLNDPVCLEFHHKDEFARNGDKTQSIAYLVRKLSFENLKKVIEEKCIVVCANCHNRIHYQHLYK